MNFFWKPAYPFPWRYCQLPSTMHTKLWRFSHAFLSLQNLSTHCLNPGVCSVSMPPVNTSQTIAPISQNTRFYGLCNPDSRVVRNEECHGFRPSLLTFAIMVLAEDYLHVLTIPSFYLCFRMLQLIITSVGMPDKSKTCNRQQCQ